MARSFKKVSIVGNCAGSDKADKVAANRRLRHANKARLAKGYELVSLREVSNVWDFAKDGKSFVNGIVRK